MYGMLILVALAMARTSGRAPVQADAKPAAPESVAVACAARVFFLEFDSDTVVPVTPDRITRQYDISSCLNPGVVKHLVELMDSAASGGQFGRSLVRLSIQLPNSKRYLVDKHGVVEVGGRDFTLSAAALYDLRNTLFMSLPIMTAP